MKFSFKLFDKRASKNHVFWEGHKNWQYLHRPTIWQYVITVKSTVKISSIFVSFFENMNFTDKSRFKKDCSINQNFTKPKKWPDLRKENSTNWVFLVVLDSFYLFPKNYFQPTSFLYRNLSAWIKSLNGLSENYQPVRNFLSHQNRRLLSVLHSNVQ